MFSSARIIERGVCYMVVPLTKNTVKKQTQRPKPKPKQKRKSTAKRVSTKPKPKPKAKGRKPTTPLGKSRPKRAGK